MTLFQKFFKAQANPVEGLQQKQEKRKKRKGEKKYQNFDFCACQSHNALKGNAGGKKGKLLCCKRIFDRIEGNLAEIQPKNHQNVQKTHFLQKNGSRSQWVNTAVETKMQTVDLNLI